MRKKLTSSEAYRQGAARLDSAWERASKGDGAPLPPAIRDDIDLVMDAGNGVAQLFALPGQLLLKATVNPDSSLRLRNFETVEGQFSARVFNNKTILKHPEVAGRLGTSADPYVSNPLRKREVDRELASNSNDGVVWAALIRILDWVDKNPDRAEDVLTQTLAQIRDWPLQDRSSTPKGAEPVPKRDLSALAKETGSPEGLILSLIDVLESDHPQVVLAGPPGTSKTHTAIALADYLAGDNRRVVQLHASYGYEEFVEGLRPTPTDTGMGFTFEVKAGVIRRVAEEVGDEKFVLILDEFNRANLPRLLGELLYALERRGEPVDLLHSTDFALPKSLLIIATMNTADKGIRSIDAAIRRRFQFFEFAPSPEILTAFYEQRPNAVVDLVEGFVALNDDLANLLDRHHTVGHTYFMDRRGMTNERLLQVWDRQIFPLLEDYLFDMPDRLDSFRVDAYWPTVVA